MCRKHNDPITEPTSFNLKPSEPPIFFNYKIVTVFITKRHQDVLAVCDKCGEDRRF